MAASGRHGGAGGVSPAETDPDKYCPLCEMSFTSEKNAQQHYQGKNHAKKLRSIATSSNDKGNGGQRKGKADSDLIDLTEHGDGDDEFVISTDKIKLLQEVQDKVYEVFQVTLTLRDKSGGGKRQWVELNGSPQCRKLAKEYIQTLCNPIEVQPMRYPQELEPILTNPDVQSDIEKRSRAVIRFEQPGEVLIYGNDSLNVTLAYSAIEDLISRHLDEVNWDVEETISGDQKRRASHRLNEALIRRISTEDGANVNEEDLSSMSNVVKRTILDVLTAQKPQDDSLEYYGITPHVVQDSSSVSDKTRNVQPMEVGPSLGEAAKQLKLIQISTDGEASEPVELPKPSTASASATISHPISETVSPEKGKYLKDWALHKGFSQEKIDLVFHTHGYDLQFHDFYRYLNNIGPATDASSKKPSSASTATSNVQEGAVQTDASTTQKSDDQKTGPSRQVASYIARLSRDHVEEEELEDIEALKDRNAERQRLLMKIFEKRKNNLDLEDDVVDLTETASQEEDEESVEEVDYPFHPYQGYKNNAKGNHGNQNRDNKHPLDHGPNYGDHQSRSSAKNHLPHERNYLIGKSPSPKRYRGPHYTQQPASSHNSITGKVSTDSASVQPAASTTSAKADHRYIVIDGSNIAMTHGNSKVFSCRGIQLCIEYFQKRGHKDITAFVPQWRRKMPTPSDPVTDHHLLEDLKKAGFIVFTPSRKVPQGKNIVCYDDRYVIQLAQETDGIIVSNDQYRDLWHEEPKWRPVIEHRLLMYSFVGDIFMPPNDPLGKDGPRLDEFLRKGNDRMFMQQGSSSQGAGLFGSYQPQYNTTGPRPYHQQLYQQYQLPQGQHRAWAPNSQRPHGPWQGQTRQPYHQQPRQQHRPAQTHNRFQGQSHSIRRMQSTDTGYHNSGFKNPSGFDSGFDSTDTGSSWKQVQRKNPPQTGPSSGTRRDPSVTKDLHDTLKAIFTNSEDAIQKVLNENPGETDMNTLSDYVLNYLS